MVTYCATRLTSKYSTIIKQFGINHYRVVIMTLQTLRLGKCWKRYKTYMRDRLSYLYLLFTAELFKTLKHPPKGGLFSV